MLVDHGDVFAERGEWVEVSICDDCAVWQANGDLSGVDDPKHAEAVTGVGGRWVVGQPQGFSWSRCDACHDSRGGSRFSGWFWLGEVFDSNNEEVGK